jgi:RimJ/RimL family protein N-acetyltransferase
LNAARTRFTDRLRLEPIGPHLVDDLWTLHQDAAVAEWWDGPWPREKAQETAESFGRAWEERGVHKWMAYDRETGELVGRGGVSRWPVDGEERLEIGWALLGSRWGRGYATEIGHAGFAFAFEELGADEVVAFTEPHNERSRAVMERLGMHSPRDIVHDGSPFVLYVFQRRDYDGSS